MFIYNVHYAHFGILVLLVIIKVQGRKAFSKTVAVNFYADRLNSYDGHDV